MSTEWDRYDIDGFEDAVEVGRGGFGVVYRARQQSLDRTVAVKVIGQAQRRSRVQTELQALGALSGHPHIVTVFSHGESPSGYLYIVMDHLPGGSMHDRGVATPAAVAAVGVKLAGALETAHRMGILHRDIKPANILVNAFGEPQLADFGIARLVSAQTSTTGHATGTLAHTPAELLEGADATVRSDVFSLGSTLYTMLAGHPPFVVDDAISMANLLYRIVTGTYPDLRETGVPSALAAVIDAMLARDPADRPATALAAGQALRQAQAGLGWTPSALLVGGPEGQVIRDEPVVAPRPDRPTITVEGPPAVPQDVELPGARRTPVVLGGIIAVFVVAAIGATFVLTRGGGDGDDPASEEAVVPTTTQPTEVQEVAAGSGVVDKPEVQLDLGDFVTFPYVEIGLDHSRPADLSLAVGVLDADGQRRCEIPLVMADTVVPEVGDPVRVSASVEACAEWLPATADQPWFLRAVDGPAAGSGTIESFTLAASADSLISAEGLPVAVPDNSLEGLVLLLPTVADPPPTGAADGDPSPVAPNPPPVQPNPPPVQPNPPPVVANPPPVQPNPPAVPNPPPVVANPPPANPPPPTSSPD